MACYRQKSAEFLFVDRAETNSDRKEKGAPAVVFRSGCGIRAGKPSPAVYNKRNRSRIGDLPVFRTWLERTACRCCICSSLHGVLGGMSVPRIPAQAPCPPLRLSGRKCRASCHFRADARRNVFFAVGVLRAILVTLLTPDRNDRLGAWVSQ